MKRFITLLQILVLMTSISCVHADNEVRLVTDRSLELTGFQAGCSYGSDIDFRNDFVMAYGAADPRLPDFIRTWASKDYIMHMMTGIAWGDYDDFRDLNGNDIMSLTQINADGSEKIHNARIPYVVPSIEFADYITEKLKPIIDSGVVAIHLEEPEFWAKTGFSKAFQKEWDIFYGEPFVSPDATADAQYKASQLKYYLYSRTLRRVAEACKDYALKKHNRKLRIYVPTHSLINYTQWSIVSPQSSLIDLDVIDGCIAQIWTGTAKTANVFEGKRSRRTFETAFLEYGVMQELVRNTNRQMWFLHDPIEDNLNHGWDSYRFNYKATVIASLLHPYVWNYEVCPWPSRIFRRRYPDNAEDGIYIPDDYATTLFTVFNQLRDMNQKEIEWFNATHGIGVLIGDSSMFQRAEPAYKLSAKNTNDPTKATGSEIDDFSAFYGLTLPLLKRGVPVQPVQIDNITRFANYLDMYKVLVLSYEFMKPQTPATNQVLAEWTARGGSLVYVGADTDPFNNVDEWWNSGKNDYKAPAQHLMEILGLKRNAKSGVYSFGKGHVYVDRKHPAHYTRSTKASDKYRSIVKQAAEAVNLEYIENNYLHLNRGPYTIAACLKESISNKPFELKGLFVDIFDPELNVLEKITVKPGHCTWVIDLNKLQTVKAEPVASSSRFEVWEEIKNGIKFKLTGPKTGNMLSRIRLPRQPAKVMIDGKKFTDYSWHKKSKTILFESPDFEDRQLVQITW